MRENVKISVIDKKRNKLLKKIFFTKKIETVISFAQVYQNKSI